MDVRIQFVRELVKSKVIAVEYVPSKKEQYADIADIITKSLSGVDFRVNMGFLVNLLYV